MKLSKRIISPSPLPVVFSSSAEKQNFDINLSDSDGEILEVGKEEREEEEKIQIDSLQEEHVKKLLSRAKDISSENQDEKEFFMRGLNFFPKYKSL